MLLVTDCSTGPTTDVCDTVSSGMLPAARVDPSASVISVSLTPGEPVATEYVEVAEDPVVTHRYG